ncbi:DUF3187 family protein [Vibrio sp. SCSIO 43153]|uniref:DUF3187 family protein n=1 Tax=Vibrio sp. SCSIO 43153 TaxID=2819098 RepID=UPI00207543C9|nr:DUF3187 family protein [Vibrio sp. SCSIO 43153]USD48876.1 DUF3187 family protein [Vibrio sp. SCSIO 43153]
MHFRLRLSVISLLTAYPSITYATSDLYGPLRSYAQSPIQVVSHTNVLRSGYSLPSGYVEAYASGTIASVWAHTSDYSLDYYHNQLELGGKWQINEKWQWELNYRWVFAADNHLDGLTESFHDFFGIGQNGRDEVDKNRFYMSMPEYDILIENFEGETLANNLSTYLQYQLLQNEHHGLSIGGSLYYNDVPHGTFKGTSFEQGLQINYTYQLNSANVFYSMVGMTFRSGDRALKDFPYRHNTAAFASGYRYALKENHHFILEYHWYQGSTEGPSEFADTSNEFVIGYRYLMENSAIEIMAIENARNMDNSTDIAFTFGYRYLFSPETES